MFPRSLLQETVGSWRSLPNPVHVLCPHRLPRSAHNTCSVPAYPAPTETFKNTGCPSASGVGTGPVDGPWEGCLEVPQKPPPSSELTCLLTVLHFPAADEPVPRDYNMSGLSLSRETSPLARSGWHGAWAVGRWRFGLGARYPELGELLDLGGWLIQVGRSWLARSLCSPRREGLMSRQGSEQAPLSSGRSSSSDKSGFSPAETPALQCAVLWKACEVGQTKS